MNTFSNDQAHESGPEAVGIVVGRDLMFTAKVTGTAGDLGYRMRVAGDVATARALIEEMRPRVILVDLAAGVVACCDDFRRRPLARSSRRLGQPVL